MNDAELFGVHVTQASLLMFKTDSKITFRILYKNMLDTRPNIIKWGDV